MGGSLADVGGSLVDVGGGLAEVGGSLADVGGALAFSDIAIIKLEPLVSIRPWWPMHGVRGRRNHIEFTDLRKHYMQR